MFFFFFFFYELPLSAFLRVVDSHVTHCAPLAFKTFMGKNLLFYNVLDTDYFSGIFRPSLGRRCNCSVCIHRHWVPIP
jgi:hypothetical protein